MSVISLSDHACTCALIHQGLFAVCARMVLNFLAMALVKLACSEYNVSLFLQGIKIS